MLKMFLELLLSLLLPSAESLMVTMQVTFCATFVLAIFTTIVFSFHPAYPFTVLSRMEASQTIQATSNGETDSSCLSSLSASASGERHAVIILLIIDTSYIKGSKYFTLYIGDNEDC